MSESNYNKGQKEAPLSKDEKFSEFINAYALSWAANHFITIMNPEQRVNFLAAVAKTYPNEWKATLNKLVSEMVQDK